MAIERDGNLLEFSCDGKPKCGEVSEVFKDFKEALQTIREAGWMIGKRNEEWIHLCPYHKAKYQGQLRNLAKELNNG